MKLPDRIVLRESSRDNLNKLATDHHYMRRPIHPLSCPFDWIVEFDGKTTMSDGLPAGFIIFASIHYTKLKGEFGYLNLPTKWQVLSLARLWLHDDLPRNSETVTIAKAMKLVQRRWLEIHPPRFLDQPYHIRKIISYADTGVGHQGTIYKAANFRTYGRTKGGPRHKPKTRGTPTGTEKICYIYDLPEPNFVYQPQQPTLFQKK